MKNNHLELKNCIQNTFGQEILYSKDCILLEEDIYDKIHLKISAQTLRRLFGFLAANVQISNTSLKHLSNYCGYTSYNELLNDSYNSSEDNYTNDLKYIKLFYSVDYSNSNFDENYHNAAKNLAKSIINNKGLLNKSTTFLSKNKTAQIYFFERFPYVDGLANGYQIHVQKYLKEKKNTEAQLFGYCLLYLGSALSNNPNRSEILNKINAIKIKENIHPFPLARKYMSNILENYLNNNTKELEKWIKESLIESAKINCLNKEYSFFPFFQLIIADVLNLINRPIEAAEIIKTAELDYKRIPNSLLDNGYFEVFDIIKAINLFQLGEINDTKRILKRTKYNDVIFIMHDYFLIQRLILELNFIKSKASIKYQSKVKDLKHLIKKTNFSFFENKL
jgi:hypothetical protein